MDEVLLKLEASFDDGKLIIRREDRQPISIVTHEEISEECVSEECVEVLELNSGSRNAVIAMQALLNCHGQHIETDGIFGPLTQTALIIFQDQKKLPATGTCDTLTWSALIRS